LRLSAYYPFAHVPRLELCVVPRFPSRPLCQEQALQSLVSRSAVARRSGAFPEFGDGYLSQHESVALLRPMLDLAPENALFEANIWGMLFYAMQIVKNESGTAGVHLYRVVGSLLLFVRHAARMLELMGYTGPILVETNLAAIQRVPWLHGPGGVLVTHAGSVLDDSVRFSLPTTVESLSSNLDDFVKGILRRVLFAVNWPDQVHTTEKLEELLHKGYQFNGLDLDTEVARDSQSCGTGSHTRTVHTRGAAE
jgi:hypothetical protein